jgi:hypothetical protein
MSESEREALLSRFGEVIEAHIDAEIQQAIAAATVAVQLGPIGVRQPKRCRCQGVRPPEKLPSNVA